MRIIKSPRTFLRTNPKCSEDFKPPSASLHFGSFIFFTLYWLSGSFTLYTPDLTLSELVHPCLLQSGPTHCVARARCRVCCPEYCCFLMSVLPTASGGRGVKAKELEGIFSPLSPSHKAGHLLVEEWGSCRVSSPSSPPWGQLTVSPSTRASANEGQG